MEIDIYNVCYRSVHAECDVLDFGVWKSCLIEVHLANFAAKTSTFSSLAASESSSSQRDMRAAAIGPERWAWRPESSAKASKMPNVEASSLSANHTVVSRSSLASRRAPLRNSSTCFSFSGFAFKVARMPTLTLVLIWIGILLRLGGYELWTYESW